MKACLRLNVTLPEDANVIELALALYGFFSDDPNNLFPEIESVGGVSVDVDW